MEPKKQYAAGPRVAHIEAAEEAYKKANPKEDKPVFKQDRMGRPWVPNSATWNGSFAASDSSPSIRDTNFVAEASAAESACTGCFLIFHKSNLSEGKCASCR